MYKKLFISIISVLTIFLVSSCSKASEPKTTEVAQSSKQVLNVYKNPSCGCCEKWVAHINTAGFQSKVHNRADLSSLKQKKGIAPRYRSCHTAISQDGYVFEGHVPAKFIKKFLLEQPKDALGLSVPAMPAGTPGMEMGNRFMPYQVLLLKKDGTSEIYAFVKSSKEQF
ncbi:MAG: hypothetical protein COB35_12800 [Gammaproteobacteria bacterium]|nr:MAG: hypothetical protein COB35_12800 [Gammaproteobacteria bacterium]